MNCTIFGRARRACLGLLVALASVAVCSTADAVSRLSGYAYIDRNNDGQIAFSNQTHPEWVLSGVEVRLFRVSGTTETLLSTATTNSIGQYLFSGLAAGTYAIRQTQPVEYIDGLETLGAITRLAGGAAPGANAGAVAANAFVGIILPDNARGDMYNFGERGLAPAFVSKRFLLGTAPPPIIAPDPEPQSIPEPTAGALIAAGAIGWLAVKRRAATRAVM